MAAITDEMEGGFFRACKRNQLAEVARMLDEEPALIDLLKQENNAVAYVCLQINTHGASLPSCDGPQDCLAMVGLLLDRGCDPCVRGNTGVMTALHYAANANEALSQVEIVRLLVQRGADPEASIEWDPSLTPFRQVPPPPAEVVDILRNAAAIRRAWEEEAAAAVAAVAQAAEAVPPIRAMYPGMEPKDIFIKAIRYAREDDVLLLLQDYHAEVINQAMGNHAPIEHVALLMHMAAPVTDGLDDEKVRRALLFSQPTFLELTV
jgi:ankyrin repeat protein